MERISVDAMKKMVEYDGATSSKGNQNKWYADGKWYKEDGLGYEALAETVVSRLLLKTSVRETVSYEYVELQKGSEVFHGCVSENFMDLSDDKIVSVERLFQAYEGEGASRMVLKREDTIGRIRYVADVVQAATGLPDFGRYLRDILTIDAIFLNEDRHFHNLAVIRKKDGTYRSCPVFDNGASLFSDTKGEYPLSMTAEECLKKVHAKPFSMDFDEQLDACELAFPQYPFHADFALKDVGNILKEFKGIYEDAALERVYDTMAAQIRKYGYLFRR